MFFGRHKLLSMILCSCVSGAKRIGDSWSRGGGFSLDLLFTVRSDKSAHHTYGLTRLGIPELGLLSSAPQAREALPPRVVVMIKSIGSRSFA